MQYLTRKNFFHKKPFGRLIRPHCGEFNVPPNSEVMVAFYFLSDDLGYDDVNIKINGKWAVVNGITQREFSTSEKTHKDNIITWGVRTWLPPRDILVQAWCGQEASTIEQRFYVRGAKQEVSPIKYPAAKTFCGFFYCEKDEIPFPSQVSVNRKTGAVKIDNQIKGYVDSVNTSSFCHRTKDNSWIYLTVDNGKTILQSPSFYKIYDTEPINYAIHENWVHLQVDKNTVAHIMHKDPDLRMFTTRHKMYKWDTYFHPDLHIWKHSGGFISKKNPEPSIGYSDDMLWTFEDLEVHEIKDIEIIDGNNIIINKRKLATIYPPEVINI